jgi:hypothetical protein
MTVPCTFRIKPKVNRDLPPGGVLRDYSRDASRQFDESDSGRKSPANPPPKASVSAKPQNATSNCGWRKANH